MFNTTSTKGSTMTDLTSDRPARAPRRRRRAVTAAIAIGLFAVLASACTPSGGQVESASASRSYNLLTGGRPTSTKCSDGIKRPSGDYAQTCTVTGWVGQKKTTRTYSVYSDYDGRRPNTVYVSVWEGGKRRFFCEAEKNVWTPTCFR